MIFCLASSIRESPQVLYHHSTLHGWIWTELLHLGVVMPFVLHAILLVVVAFDEHTYNLTLLYNRWIQLNPFTSRFVSMFSRMYSFPFICAIDSNNDDRRMINHNCARIMWYAITLITLYVHLFKAIQILSPFHQLHLFRAIILLLFIHSFLKWSIFI